MSTLFLYALNIQIILMYQILIIDVINLEEQFMARIFRNCLMKERIERGYIFIMILYKKVSRISS